MAHVTSSILQEFLPASLKSKTAFLHPVTKYIPSILRNTPSTVSPLNPSTTPFWYLSLSLSPRKYHLYHAHIFLSVQIRIHESTSLYAYLQLQQDRTLQIWAVFKNLGHDVAINSPIQNLSFQAVSQARTLNIPRMVGKFLFVMLHSD